jgi:predicted nucleic acid-binding protein
MLFDTDVLIWVLRGDAKAVRAVDRDEDRMVSVVTCMELFQGARDKKEMASIRRFLRHFDTAPLSENIGHRAGIYMEEYALKSGLGVPDALIAATAAENKISLCSGNAKHYRAISELELKVFRPS